MYIGAFKPLSPNKRHWMEFTNEGFVWLTTMFLNMFAIGG